MGFKFKHTTCKENLKKDDTIDIHILRSKFIIYVAMLLFSYLSALVLFYINPLLDFEYFSFFVACGSWSVFYGNSQKIIDYNEFLQFAILGFFIIILSITMIIITKSNYSNFIITGYPLLYIFYFRILIFLFYRDSVRLYTKPTVLFARKFGNWTHENINRNYIPTKKEIIFSDLLFFGPWGLAGVIFYMVIKL